jgi:hypothetical protein
MLTHVSTLKFADGAFVTARLSAISPAIASKVEWSGAIDKVPREKRYENAPVDVVRSLFRTLAKRSNATYEEITEGNYESWPL